MSSTSPSKPLLVVSWLDPKDYDSIRESDLAIERPVITETVGFLVLECDDWIMLSNNIDEDGFHSGTLIMKSLIRDRRAL